LLRGEFKGKLEKTPIMGNDLMEAKQLLELQYVYYMYKVSMSNKEDKDEVVDEVKQLYISSPLNTLEVSTFISLMVV
jgi:hypothetical protein